MGRKGRKGERRGGEREGETRVKVRERKKRRDILERKVRGIGQEERGEGVGGGGASPSPVMVRKTLHYFLIDITATILTFHCVSGEGDKARRKEGRQAGCSAWTCRLYCALLPSFVPFFLTTPDVHLSSRQQTNMKALKNSQVVHNRSLGVR